MKQNNKNNRNFRNKMILNVVLCVFFLSLLTFILIWIGTDVLKKKEHTGNKKDDGKDIVTIEPEETGELIFKIGASKADHDDESVDGIAMDDDGDLSAEEIYDQMVEQIIQEMSLHEKICQMIVVTPEGLTGVSRVTSAGEVTHNSLNEYPVGGICFLAQNIKSRDQIVEMIGNIQSYSKENHGIGAFITLDEEGGNVARVAVTLGTTKFEPMYNYKDLGAATAYQNAKTIGEDISAIGVNLDLAPVADVWTNPANTVIGTRAYSDDYEQAANLVGSAVAGFHDGGVMCVLKHFPGHGDTKEDSHYGTAITNKALEEMRDEEFLPFIAGINAGAEMVMSSHVTATQIDELPTSLSPRVIGILRDELGFDGVVITDSLSMSALIKYYDYSQIGVMAVMAGNDVLLCQDGMKQMVAGLEKAVEDGVVSEEQINLSVRRILNLKLQHGLL